MNVLSSKEIHGFLINFVVVNAGQILSFRFEIGNRIWKIFWVVFTVFLASAWRFLGVIQCRSSLKRFVYIIWTSSTDCVLDFRRRFAVTATLLLCFLNVNGFEIFFYYLSQIYDLLYNGAISKYVVRKHLCGAIIQWWFSYVYRALCCAERWWNDDSPIYTAHDVVRSDHPMMILLCILCIMLCGAIIQWWFSCIMLCEPLFFFLSLVLQVRRPLPF
jgi:hypothetical protein